MKMTKIARWTRGINQTVHQAIQKKGAKPKHVARKCLNRWHTKSAKKPKQGGKKKIKEKPKQRPKQTAKTRRHMTQHIAIN